VRWLVIDADEGVGSTIAPKRTPQSGRPTSGGPAGQEFDMQYLSPAEKTKLDDRLEELRRAKVEVQDRITAAAGLGDLSENAEYHFAKEENRKIEREIADLEKKMGQVVVADADDVPDDMVFLGSTVKVKDVDDGEEMTVRLVGEAETPDPDSDVQDVSASSPMGDALMKARVGDTVTVKAPKGSMQFEVVDIV
jgi:transcription elongation factor GreA